MAGQSLRWEEERERVSLGDSGRFHVATVQFDHEKGEWNWRCM